MYIIPLSMNSSLNGLIKNFHGRTKGVNYTFDLTDYIPAKKKKGAKRLATDDQRLY